MFTWLQLSASSLAILGALAMALPIIIHLLNKRRFKIVDWAAMEFLFDADRRNRRRLRLENLILLLLRCLAVFLLGLLLARPFAEGALSRLTKAEQYERIVLLDDSLSMLTQSDNQSGMDEAKKSLLSIARELTDSTSDDSLTVILTSRPEAPLINGQRITGSSIAEIEAEIQELQPSDKAANLDVALQELERYMTAEKEVANRVVYVLTDLREQDWQLEDTIDDDNHPAKVLQRIAKDISGCFLVDVGNEEESNIAITDIRPEDTLVAGVASRFDVTVKNTGDEVVEDIRVRFTAGDSIPLEEEIVKIDAGKTETVQFNFTFAQEDFTEESSGVDPEDEHATSSIRIMAQVVAGDANKQDRLLADSERFFAARVIRGIPTLIVDGDPSAVYGRSESMYLRRALSPPGDAMSGVVVDVVTDTELETVDLNRYQVIFLCNVYRLSEDRIKALESWTEAGGGLVIMVGDQVDEDAFNEQLHREGQGLSPFKLDGLYGDETNTEWANFRVEVDNHPILRIFEGQNNIFLDRVKIFRWWGTSIPKKQLGASVTVSSRLTDENDSVAIAEKPFGSGRVLATCIPADRDWTNWADDPSYIIVTNEIVRYMAGNVAGSGDLRVGEPLRFALDLVEYRESATLKLPDEERVNVQAAYLVEGDDEENGKTVRRIDYQDASRRGFYQLQLTSTDGSNNEVLFAANIDPREGNLRRLNSAARDKLSSEDVKIVSSTQAAAQAVRGLRQEFWWLFLYALIGVLCIEQFLGWFFGSKRK